MSYTAAQIGPREPLSAALIEKFSATVVYNGLM